MEFRITKTMRRGKVAIWVNVPAVGVGENIYNVWDVSEELAADPDFEKAILHAFELGMQTQRGLVSRLLWGLQARKPWGGSSSTLRPLMPWSANLPALEGPLGFKRG